MAATSARRAILPVVAILVLTAIAGRVWWLVLHREPSTGKPTAKTTLSTSCVTVTGRPVAWPVPQTITLSVLNATDRAGLAATVTAQMKQRGFKTIKPDNDDKKSTVTEIRFASRYATTARLVQFYLPGSKLVTTPGTAPTIVVAVGQAYKALATPAQVSTDKAKAPAVRAC